jgi:hypothetical protein
MMRLFWISLIYLISATGSYANICIPERGNFLKVMNVASDDTLNVRAGITTKTQVLGELAPTQSDLYYLGVQYKSDECRNLCEAFLSGQDGLETIIANNCRNKSKIWYQIASPTSIIGWASGKYLAEYARVESVTVSPSVSDTVPKVPIVSAPVSDGLANCPKSGFFNNCFGERIEASGDKYVGEFRDGKFNGQGTMTRSNGGKYVGEFRDGYFNGQGTEFYSSDGSTYAGDFKGGRPHGNGTWTAPNSSGGEDEYVGEFNNGSMTGQGTYTYASGEVEVGIFDNGNLVSIEAELQKVVKLFFKAEACYEKYLLDNNVFEYIKVQLAQKLDEMEKAHNETMQYQLVEYELVQNGTKARTSIVMDSNICSLIPLAAMAGTYFNN